MDFSIDNSVLKIYLKGKIDSNNSENILEEVLKISSENFHEAMELDANELVYISSAGIRVLLKLAKMEKNFKVINTCADVYEIFEITGLTTVLEISRKLRKVSISGAKLIGKGFFSEVYRIDKDTIVKVFVKSSNYGEVKKELDMAKQGFILGLPTAISYDVVDVDGKYGVVFELLDCSSLRDEIEKNPNRFDEYMNLYAKLVKDINSTNIASCVLPSAKENALKKIEFIKEYLTSEEYAKINSLINEIPDEKTFVHGDCQIKNIMINKGEALLIDMETLSYGAPIFELAALYASYKGFGEIQRGYEGAFFELPNDIPSKIFDEMIEKYFDELPSETLEENVKKISLICYLHMMWWLSVNKEKYSENYKKDVEYIYGRFKEVLSKTNDLELKMHI